MRRAFIIEMLNDGADSGLVSQIVGHRSVVTTVDQYGQFGRDGRLQRHHALHSPLSKDGG
jgi:site-specific recombinase XerD